MNHLLQPYNPFPETTVHHDHDNVFVKNGDKIIRLSRPNKRSGCPKCGIEMSNTAKVAGTLLFVHHLSYKICPNCKTEMSREEYSQMESSRSLDRDEAEKNAILEACLKLQYENH